MNAECRVPRARTAGVGDPTRPVVRCAIYTRKSTDENTDNDFNSLDAQREAGEMYVRSQASEGWIVLSDRYDDVAFSGATLERPALQRLLGDVEAGRVDTIVVYKIDRLSRSLLDFTKLIETLEAYGTSLVAVTQQFNTTTSMGRLTLNILLSFSQFEREVIAERIRDKMAAAKRRGKYVGGIPPLGYDVDRQAKKLIVNAREAVLVRTIFRRYLQLGSTLALIRELNAQGYTTKAWTTKKGVKRPGAPWNTGAIYKLLNNPVLVGRVRHKDMTYPGEHQAIVESSLWDEVQAALAVNHRSRGNRSRSTTPAPLRGIIRCGHCDAGMTPTFTRKNGRTYRYYLCGHAAKNGRKTCPVRTVPAGDVEAVVLAQVQRVFRSPEVRGPSLAFIQRREQDDLQRLAAEKVILVNEIETVRAAAGRILQTAGEEGEGGAGSTLAGEELARMDSQVMGLRERLDLISGEIDLLERQPTTEGALADELEAFDRIWGELVPAEQERLVRLVVERVTVNPDGIDFALRADGVASLVREIESGRGARDGGAHQEARGSERAVRALGAAHG